MSPLIPLLMQDRKLLSWDRRQSEIITPTDDFLHRITEPSDLNTGASTGIYRGIPLVTVLAGGDGSGVLRSAVAGERFENLNIIGRWKAGAANQELINCVVNGEPSRPANWVQGNDYVLVDMTGNYGSSSMAKIEHVTAKPTYTWTDVYGVKGGGFRMKRCNVSRVTDTVLHYRYPVEIIDCFLHELIRFADDTPRHSDGTHNDGDQAQGGSTTLIDGTKIDVTMEELLGSLTAVLATSDYATHVSYILQHSWLMGGSVPVNIAIPGGPIIQIINNKIRLGQRVYSTSPTQAHIIIPSATRTHANTIIAGNTDYDTGGPIVIKNG